VRSNAAGAVVGVMLLLPMAAWAVDDIPFAITGAANGTIACRGPGFSDIAPRLSGRHSFEANSRQVFYRADINIFSPFGRWECSVDVFNGGAELPENKANAVFCLQSGSVELRWDGAGSLTADQPLVCISTLASSVLGQTGEADASPAQDVDTYSFQGKAGERVELTLGRDGAAGSTGEIATLRVRAKSGGVIGTRTGPVPIRLELTLPGPVEVEVARSAAKPGGVAFRGYYQLKVAPASGDLRGRLLVPANNVEH
jgi:hypothetical protein